MRPKILFAFVGICVLSSLVLAGSGFENEVEAAVSADNEKASAAVRVLRANKQAGLDALLKRYSIEIDQVSSNRKPVGNWREISDALDSVAMQKDAYSSRLYWFTDLEEAKTAAADSGKPILSLRLLGNLNEEYSCANSRFFRSILYSDPAIAKTLRENFILHWESVRPAPRITIDFGDGRKLVRTITGNSIHYILDSRGVLVDALPGLYSPKKFNEYLVRLNGIVRSPNYGPRLSAYYRSETAMAITTDWREKLALLGKTPEQPLPGNSTAALTLTPSSGLPTALEAAPLVVTKAALELPTVLSLSPEIERLRTTTRFEDWKQMAQLDGAVSFSPESVSLMRSKTSNLNDTEFVLMLESLKEYVAIDTAQNEYRFHSKLLAWINPNSASRLPEFNRFVYSDLFLTPGDDKWLGLYSADIYAAIENNGVQ